MLSARAGEEGTLEGLDAGADDYLVKPFTARELHGPGARQPRARPGPPYPAAAASAAGACSTRRSGSPRSAAGRSTCATGQVECSEEFLRIDGPQPPRSSPRWATRGVVDELVPPRRPGRVVQRALDAGRRSTGFHYETRVVRPDGDAVLVAVLRRGGARRARRARRRCAARCRTSPSAGPPRRRWRWPPRTPRRPRASTRSPTSCSAACCRRPASTSSTSRWRPTTGPASRAPRSAATGTT